MAERLGGRGAGDGPHTQGGGRERERESKMVGRHRAAGRSTRWQFILVVVCLVKQDQVGGFWGGLERDEVAGFCVVKRDQEEIL